MTITEFYAVPYSIMTNETVTLFPFFSANELEQTNTVIKNSFGNREIFFSETETALQTRVQNAVKTLFQTNTYMFTKLKESMNLTYSPFQRTDLSETDTETHSGTDTKTNTHSGTTGTTVTPATISTGSNKAYDGAVMVEVDKVVNSGTETTSGSNSGTNTDTENFGHVITKSHTITGTENVDFESVIESERKIAEFDFISKIAKMIADTICLSIYNFDNEYVPYNPFT